MYSTGLAYWETSEYPSIVKLITQKPTVYNNYLQTIVKQAQGIYNYDLTLPSDPQTVVIEFPIFYASSSLGHAVASTGGLLKLCAVTGAIASIYDYKAVHAVPVNIWKGQLPKRVVMERIIRIIGQAKCNELKLQKDMWDAVGIGLWAL